MKKAPKIVSIIASVLILCSGAYAGFVKTTTTSGSSDAAEFGPPNPITGYPLWWWWSTAIPGWYAAVSGAIYNVQPGSPGITLGPITAWFQKRIEIHWEEQVPDEPQPSAWHIEWAGSLGAQVGVRADPLYASSAYASGSSGYQMGSLVVSASVPYVDPITQQTVYQTGGGDVKHFTWENPPGYYMADVGGLARISLSGNGNPSAAAQAFGHLDGTVVVDSP